MYVQRYFGQKNCNYQEQRYEIHTIVELTQRHLRLPPLWQTELILTMAAMTITQPRSHKSYPDAVAVLSTADQEFLSTG